MLGEEAMAPNTTRLPTLRAPHGSSASPKRVGRGPSSGRGKTAGAGQKGQLARSGGGVRLGFEGGQMPLYRRVARRGFSNARFKRSYKALSLAKIASHFTKGEEVSLQSLKDRRIIKGRAPLVKIVSGSPLKTALHVVGIPLTQSVREAILKAGGSIESASPQTQRKSTSPATRPTSTKVEANE